MRRGVYILAAAVAASVCLPVAANADWAFSETSSAFTERNTAFVLAHDGAYGFGLRCDDDGVKTMYYTPQPATPAELAPVIIWGELLLRVDGKDVIRASAVPESINGRLRLAAQFDGADIRELASAQRAVDVAFQVDGQILHETSFPVRGAAESVKQFEKACPVSSE